MKSTQYIGSASLDSTAENYEKKKARGVTGYNYYLNDGIIHKL